MSSTRAGHAVDANSTCGGLWDRLRQFHARLHSDTVVAGARSPICSHRCERRRSRCTTAQASTTPKHDTEARHRSTTPKHDTEAEADPSWGQPPPPSQVGPATWPRLARESHRSTAAFPARPSPPIEPTLLTPTISSAHSESTRTLDILFVAPATSPRPTCPRHRFHALLRTRHDEHGRCGRTPRSVDPPAPSTEKDACVTQVSAASPNRHSGFGSRFHTRSTTNSPNASMLCA